MLEPSEELDSSCLLGLSMLVQDLGGKGKPFILLCCGKEYADVSASLASVLSPASRVLTINFDSLTALNWGEFGRQLDTGLTDNRVRQANFIAFGASAVLVQDLALRNAKIVRSAVFVDGHTRPPSGFVERALSALEQRLPLGLPFRIRRKEFDGKPFLQRLRFPILLLNTVRANQYQIEQSRMMSELIPTSFLEIVSGRTAENQAKEIEVLLQEFQSVPAKCPQKAA